MMGRSEMGNELRMWQEGWEWHIMGGQGGCGGNGLFGFSVAKMSKLGEFEVTYGWHWRWVCDVRRGQTGARHSCAVGDFLPVWLLLWLSWVVTLHYADDKDVDESRQHTENDQQAYLSNLKRSIIVCYIVLDRCNDFLMVNSSVL